jgi:ATP-dependent helicase/DNAse subunit B
LRAAEDLPEEVTPLDVGSARHEILARFFQASSGQALADSDIDACLVRLHEISRAVLSKVDISRTELPEEAWAVEQEAIENELRLVISEEVEHSRATKGMWAPAYLEWDFGTDGVQALEINPDGPLVRGRIDRIDRGPGGVLAVYDYKSASTPDPGDIESLAVLQIPLYILAAQEILCREGGQVVGGCYYSIANRKVESGVWLKDYAASLRAGAKRKGKYTCEGLCEFLESVKSEAVRITQSVRSGRFRIAPRKCNPQRCRFAGVCGYDPAVAGAKQAGAEPRGAGGPRSVRHGGDAVD